MAKDVSVQQSVRQYDGVIIGGGAAGLFCAAMAGQRGRKILVIEHGGQVGAKILISGGGRCNFTNLDVSAKNFISENPHFSKSALAGFSSGDFIELVSAHGIAFHEKRLGQLFCDRSAKDIVAMLLALCAAGGVEIRVGCKVTGITKPDGYVVETDSGEFAAPALVLATGGLSIPKMGATGFAYEVARQFGLRVTGLRAGLVPFLFEGESWMQELAGVSFEAVVSTAKAAFAEAVLFTHRGMSGPAILQISSYWQPGQGVSVDMLPGRDGYELLLARKAARPRASLKTVLGEILPERLAAYLGTGGVIGEMPNKALAALSARLHKFALKPTGTEGYGKAEVTAGGVDTRDLSSKTMQALAVPGLFVIGEAVDVTGWLGGYNFQWAWASAYAAAQVL
jgi:predicted Rossmann fold flavoprotein